MKTITHEIDFKGLFIIVDCEYWYKNTRTDTDRGLLIESEISEWEITGIQVFGKDNKELKFNEEKHWRLYVHLKDYCYHNADKTNFYGIEEGA